MQLSAAISQRRIVSLHNQSGEQAELCRIYTPGPEASGTAPTFPFFLHCLFLRLPRT